MKVALTPAFVLHSRPYRETSLLLDVFSREHGRVGLVARGVRQKNSRQHGLLQPCQRLQIAWSGKSDLMTLTDVEPDNRPYNLSSHRVICGFYMNELIVRLLHQADPHADLFDTYDRTLATLDEPDSDEALAMRLFEKKILEAIGYGLVLDRDVENREAIIPGTGYFYCADRGALRLKPEHSDYVEVSGDMLIALEQEKFTDEKLLQQCKIFMRYLLQKHIGNRPLTSRQLYKSFISAAT